MTTPRKRRRPERPSVKELRDNKLALPRKNFVLYDPQTKKMTIISKYKRGWSEEGARLMAERIGATFKIKED